MRLSHDFKETIRARARADAAFREELLRQALEAVKNGDLEIAKAIVDEYAAAIGVPLDDISPSQPKD